MSSKDLMWLTSLGSFDETLALELDVLDDMSSKDLMADLAMRNEDLL